MRKTMCILICLLSIISFFACSKKELSDKEILIKIYESTNGANWTEKARQNWLSEKPLDEWEGVKVNAEGRVTGLRIYNDSVVGNIPVEIEGLSELETLSLKVKFNRKDDKEVLGYPDEINKLTNLKELTLMVSYIKNGPEINFPKISDLKALKTLTLTGFKGQIPTYLGDLSNLEKLSISGFKGPIPESICNLTNLTRLSIGNEIDPEGAVPANIGNLKKLESLNIDYSKFFGGVKASDAAFPESVWDLSNLKYLFLRGISSSSKAIPAEKVKAMKNLSTITIINSGISGTIPVEFFQDEKVNNLNGFSIYNNKLEGTIPEEIGNCTKLTSIKLDRNQLTGTIPASIANCIDLSWLDLSNNKLEGEIPSNFANLKKLNYLNLENNNLSTNYSAAFRAHKNFDKFRLKSN